MKDSDQLYIRVPEEHRAALERARAEYEKRTGEYKSLAFIAREAMIKGLGDVVLEPAPAATPARIPPNFETAEQKEKARNAALHVAKAYRVRVRDHTLVIPKGYSPERRKYLLVALAVFGNPFEVVDEA